MSQTILIIGGGIAGLCAAITLQQIGMNVKVYERNTEPTADGAGILIAPNALQALTPYRVSEEIVRRSYSSDGFHILSDRVVFIGDAAHAITPNMGQGACQAIEDARILAECLRIQHNYQGAFADYDARRRKRIKQISNQSWMVGKMAQSESFLFTSVRNRLMKHVPKWVSRNQAQRLYQFQLKS